MDDLYRRLGARIRRRRRTLRLRQDQLAERAALSRGSISNIEGGRQQLYVHHLVAIARALEQDAAALLREPELGPEAKPYLDAVRGGDTARVDSRAKS